MITEPNHYIIFNLALNICRAAIERVIQGVSPNIPLDPSEFRKPLGPGYRAGWYAWASLDGRNDNCEVEASKVDIMERRYASVQEQIARISSYEEFAKYLESNYHGSGHLDIAASCSDSGDGVMAHSSVSARDPIFYRWHGHLEDIMQQFRDTKLPS